MKFADIRGVHSCFSDGRRRPVVDEERVRIRHLVGVPRNRCVARTQANVASKAEEVYLQRLVVSTPVVEAPERTLWSTQSAENDDVCKRRGRREQARARAAELQAGGAQRQRPRGNDVTRQTFCLLIGSSQAPSLLLERRRSRVLSLFDTVQYFEASAHERPVLVHQQKRQTRVLASATSSPNHPQT